VPDLLNLKDAAALLDVDVETLRRYVSKGAIETIQYVPRGWHHIPKEVIEGLKRNLLKRKGPNQ